jgi:hypothetical protein
MNAMKKSFHLVYLNEILLSDNFKYLHPYFHPGILSKDHMAAILCREVWTGEAYLRARLLLPQEVEGKEIQLQHSLVVAVLELASHETQLGFLGQG